MSESCDALLYFGFTFHDSEEGEAPWYEPALLDDDQGDFDEWLVDKLSDLAPPDVPWNPDGENEAYHEYWNAAHEFVESLPIEIVVHADSDYPLYAICIRESKRRAWLGDPVKLGIKMESHLGWVNVLRSYCDRLGIPWQEPSWELASYRG